jgi:hypothetical protein
MNKADIIFWWNNLGVTVRNLYSRTEFNKLSSKLTDKEIAILYSKRDDLFKKITN